MSSAIPSVVVKICASTMLPPAAAQAPVMIASRRGWSGDRTVSSVDAAELVGLVGGRDGAPGLLGLAHEAGVLDPARDCSTLSQ